VPQYMFVEQRPMVGRVVPIEPDTTIGRDQCDVLLPDPEVSRRHAALTELDGEPAIEDLDSMNGTWVNGARIREPTVLHEGDAVQLGNTLWRVHAPGPETTAATVPGEDHAES
jgi:pSer/pThr/pTyr-binding forkhead associated (FHA) protein